MNIFLLFFVIQIICEMNIQVYVISCFWLLSNYVNEYSNYLVTLLKINSFNIVEIKNNKKKMHT
jgi:hypothetical protein